LAILQKTLKNNSLQNIEAKFVIISYAFPPYGGVASRRWLIFAKAMQRAGHKILIIAAQGDTFEKSAWSIGELQDKTVYLSHHYPRILKSIPKNIIEKIYYRIMLFWIKCIYRGTPYDRGIFFKKQVLSYLKNIDLDGKTVIISGAPFSLFSLSKSLKNRNANVYLDFRDPYTWGELYGMKGLSKNRFKFESNIESQAIANAARIFVPNKQMETYLKQKYIQFSDKIFLLNHPIDSDNIKEKWKPTNQKDGYINLVYAGSLYDDCTAQIADFIEILKNNKHITFTLYTDKERIPKNMVNLFLNNGQIIVKSNLPANKLFEQLLHFDAYLIISPMRGKDNISTKYPDLIYFGMPLILYSAEGDLTRFLANYKRCICINDLLLFKKSMQNILDLGKETLFFELKDFNDEQLLGRFN